MVNVTSVTIGIFLSTYLCTMTFFRKHLWTLIGVAIGALAGYIYWHQIGCLSGTCAITSSPVNSTLYGAVMGGLLLSFFQKDRKVEQQKVPDND